ncbi:TIGR03899 family protein [Alteromonas halophila]|uniref:TIGR03899 family protein n=2 Tax=Alteromonas halophila TaxID=516698 RepID=A0A918JR44_9ALTE|nr:TIGR03899 family protein [Alteromonas halophila]
MLSLFARVGISPSMSTNDASQRLHILERRRQIREMQKIDNLQAILNIALNVSVGDKEADNVDPDWFFSFCSLAENIHSPAMQELWGKIFAVEVSHPGSFSRRSLQTLESLTHRDAVIFSRAVSIASRRAGDSVPRVLVGYHVRKGLLSLIRRPVPEQLNISSFGLSYPDLLALQDMKLLYASEIESGEFAEGHHTQWRCGPETFELTSRRAGVALVYYKFTSVGAELFRLVGRQDNQAYMAALRQILGRVFIVQ